MLTLKNLETFVWVVRLGGFGHAAKRLNTTQSAVSQRIALLESALGATLLERQPRQVLPTSKGRELLPYAEQMLRLQSDLLHVIGAPDAFRGHIRLGVSETIAHTCLLHLVQKMQTTYPQVVMDIEVDISTNLRDALLRGDLDMIIPAMPILEPNVRNVDFVGYPMAWVASPALELPRTGVTLEDIAHYPVITYPKSTRPYQDLRDMFLRADITDFKIYGNTSLSAIARMCSGGIGIAAMPPEVISRELNQEELYVIDVVDAILPDLRFTISYVLTPDTHLLDAIAQFALDMLAEAENS